MVSHDCVGIFLWLCAVCAYVTRDMPASALQNCKLYTISIRNDPNFQFSFDTFVRCIFLPTNAYTWMDLNWYIVRHYEVIATTAVDDGVCIGAGMFWWLLPTSAPALLMDETASTVGSLNKFIKLYWADMIELQISIVVAIRACVRQPFCLRCVQAGRCRQTLSSSSMHLTCEWRCRCHS